MRRIVTALILALIGCIGDDITGSGSLKPVSPSPVKSISIYGPVEVENGQWVAFTVSVIDVSDAPVRNPAVNWSTSNPSVATINQTGQLHGVSEGTVTVTVSAGDRASEARLTVTPAVCHPHPWDDGCL
jgi:uncharacterized protein YjdB